MKKFEPNDAIIQNNQPFMEQSKLKGQPLLELLPQITKFLPIVQSFFQTREQQQQPAPQQQQFLTSNYQKAQNKNAAILSIENHKKFIENIKLNQ